MKASTAVLSRINTRRIWEVTFQSEDTKDGYGRIYREHKSQAKAEVKRLLREHREREKAYKDAVARGVDFYELPAHPGPQPEPEIKQLEFYGTVRQMLIQALERNA